MLLVISKCEAVNLLYQRVVDTAFVSSHGKLQNAPNLQIKTNAVYFVQVLRIV